MKYAVDKIENNIVLLEDLSTKEKKEVSVSLLPSSINEGTILIYQDGKYIIDKNTEKERRNKLKDKFNRLKNKQKN